jgi:hypothetical protein
MKYINKSIFFALIGILLLFANFSHAQQKPFKFGFKLSPALSWLSPDVDDYKYNGTSFSFAWGFVADITLMDNYYINTGFNVSYFKGKLLFPHLVIAEDASSYTGTLDRVYNLRYIEVPFAFKMKTNELAPNLQFFGLIGINTGINIRAKADDTFSGISDGGLKLNYAEEKVDIKDQASLFKASLLMGAGAEYIIDESISMMLGLNFNNGFTNVLNGINSVDKKVEAKAIPYYFELNLGVIF